MGKVKVPTVPELLDMCVESGVKIIACQMTMDVMGIKREDLIDDLEVGGAATFLGYAAESSINMFM
jgi:peroxiredoxin family protein